MDLKKYTKPIHITCPKCHYELEFAGKQIMSDKNELADDIKTLKARMQTHRNEYGKDKYYFSLVKQLKEKEAQYIRVKQVVQFVSERSELHLFILFKTACKKKFGEEIINKMLKECEDEMVYKTDDLAKQKFTNFTGA